MGYYSEAALVFTAKGAETMRSMIDEQQLGMALRQETFWKKPIRIVLTVKVLQSFSIGIPSSGIKCLRKLPALTA